MNVRNLDELNFHLRLEDIISLPSEILSNLRRECQVNLRFLVNCVLRPMSSKFIPLSERCHGQLIDSFVGPDPELEFDEWSSIKERVTVASRGILKSTVVAGSLVQLQLCSPDIRILIVSGKLPLAKTILETARQPFLTNEVIRFLFPDWAVEEDDVSGDTFVCARRNAELNLRDPTLSIATFESVKAGGHYEMIVFDDCTNEINSATADLVEKNEQHYDDTDPLVEPGGYRHFLGTRWAGDDHDIPEVIRKRGEEYAQEHGGDKNTSYLFLPAWTIRETKDEAEHREIEDRDRRNQLRPDDVVLTWPEKLSFKVLWPKYRANPNKFNLQYLLRHRESTLTASFPHDLLLKNTVPFAQGIPMAHDRFTVINWDMAGIYSGVRKRYASDFFCGLGVMFELSTGRMFIYDAVLEVFMSSTDAATVIVDFFRRQLAIGPVGICGGEDACGARMLEGEIMSIAKKAGVPMNFTWQPKGTVAGIKALRIARLAGALRRGLVQFSTTLPQRDLIFKQFEKWAPQHQQVKDDAPDCAAQIWDLYSGRIFPGEIQNLMCSGVTMFAPENVPQEGPDPHADEREYADVAWMSEMTAPHA